MRKKVFHSGMWENIENKNMINKGFVSNCGKNVENFKKKFSTIKIVKNKTLIKYMIKK